ncbi:MAG: transporter [Candidatus Sulfotelmatobacter sp.]
MIFQKVIQGAFIVLAVTIGLATAQDTSLSSTAVRQSLDDAWWTGPMLAPNATTLPRGHLLIEPYLYDVISAHANGLGSLTYINYGFRDRLTIGLIPTAGFNIANSGPSSSSVELGDLTVQGQYRLAKFHEGSSVPATSVVVQETFPTGKYDRLGDRPNGLGSGAYTTTLALYTQTYFWLPNGRILRMRFDASQALSSNVNVQDVSVYGTTTGFRGNAKPGSSFLADSSWEYSVTRKWVLAIDLTYRHNWNTRAIGYNVDSGSAENPSVLLNSGSSEVFALAPAVEYSWKPYLGVLLGTRVIPPSHNTNTTVTPAVAINFVH